MSKNKNWTAYKRPGRSKKRKFYGNAFMDSTEELENNNSMVKIIREVNKNRCEANCWRERFQRTRGKKISSPKKEI